MSLSRIGKREYVRRSALEIETAKRTQNDKTLEILLLENLKGIADLDYYRDSDYNTTTYIIYLKPQLDASYFDGDDKK